MRMNKVTKTSTSSVTLGHWLLVPLQQHAEIGDLVKWTLSQHLLLLRLYIISVFFILF